jgi:DNA repair protein RadC
LYTCIQVMGDADHGQSGHRERLCERFAHGDASSRTDAARLELLLTFGIPRRDVQPLADALLARFGGLNQVLAADAGKLAGVITDDLVAFLRKLLQEANIVHKTVSLQPILSQIGAAEEEPVEESLSKLTSLLRTAIKNAKARHGAGKRVHVLFPQDEPGDDGP